MTDDFPPELEDQPPEWIERGTDDYNVYEEQQVFLDNEGGEPDDPPEDVAVAVSVPYLVAELRPHALHISRSVAMLEAYPVATATPEERADLLELRDVLNDLASALRVRIGAIELAFKRGMEELNAREMPVAGWGPVRYVPDEGAWEVHADALRADLKELIQYGLVDEDDLEKAFKVTVTTTADNRVLNGLMKRGTAVQEAIEKNRSRREGREMGGKLTLPHRKTTKREEA